MARHWSAPHGVSNLDPEGKLIPLPERPSAGPRNRQDWQKMVQEENEVTFDHKIRASDYQPRIADSFQEITAQ